MKKRTTVRQATAILIKLAEQRPDLLARVKSGELSVGGAAAEAGLINGLPPLEHIRRIWGHLAEEHRQEFLNQKGYRLRTHGERVERCTPLQSLRGIWGNLSSTDRENFLEANGYVRKPLPDIETVRRLDSAGADKLLMELSNRSDWLSLLSVNNEQALLIERMLEEKAYERPEVDTPKSQGEAA